MADSSSSSAVESKPLKAARASTKISLTPVTANNLGTVRKLNSVLFPIKYSDRFYQDILLPEVEEFCQLAYYQDVPVGIICCRIEASEKAGEGKLYCMTMGVLAPYRDRHIGSECLQHVLKAAASYSRLRLTDIYMHVQISNTSARRFYERHGFRQIGLQERYYKKIVPRDAWVLERPVTQGEFPD
ncbi:acyl-CoA N-acyltransferase [Sistotremastrum niveocremeum HHB9708]|uniref:Acyl-CoA N-acyltransferase n=2 Tax=Sistotremastraceae TaxID=3402574 RepID=A0A165A3I9_9AGAM|nr:acyl-CoA N-acyltransferase [Sistotremastrum niveocremeum HHB9708]KZT43636.1 acyl-CoA N-acyltransferase [Sistotremastrum suecicum HHB10207 ss-3]